MEEAYFSELSSFPINIYLFWEQNQSQLAFKQVGIIDYTIHESIWRVLF